ncbi:MAG: aldo/keto reductase [Bianqueaceae bacterium]
MRTMKLGGTGLDVPVVGVGCMRLTELDLASAEQFVQTALEQGVNFFDHADIYGGGACEEIFAKAVHMKPSVRESIIPQSKCGIRLIRRGLTFQWSISHLVDGFSAGFNGLSGCFTAPSP